MSRSCSKAALFAGLSLFGLSCGVGYYRLSHGVVKLYLGGSPIPIDTLHALEPTLSQIAQKLEQLPIQVEQAPQQTYPLKVWGVRLDVPATIESAYLAWRSVPLWERVFAQPTIRIRSQWRLDPAMFERTLAQYRHLERSPQPARIHYEAGTITVIPETLGRQLDAKRSLRALVSKLHETSGETPMRFALVMKTLTPPVRAEHLQHITGEIARFTTRFPGYKVHRNHNICLAAQALNDRILMPGERLSYNEAVGARTLKQGFRLAPVIIRGEKRLGIGGGICQVSSTLYNAALLGGLKIVRRANHSIPVTYVPLGRDATVTDTGLDLVIENPYPYPIAIATQVGRSSVTVILLGVPQPSRRIVLTTERTLLKSPPTQEVPDPTLPLGTLKVQQKGSAGVRVVLWRWTYENGQLVRKERVATSIYRSQPHIVQVGAKPTKPNQSFADE
ncbi:MAG: hypothetical protein C4300_00125 [Thermus sp.]